MSSVVCIIVQFKQEQHLLFDAHAVLVVVN